MMRTSPRNPLFWIVLGGLVAGAMGFSVSLRGSFLKKEPLDAPRPFSSLYDESPSWTRPPPPFHEDIIESPDIVQTLGTENYLTRHMIRRPGPDDTRPERLQVHLAYYTGMIDTVPHVPERCFVGGGLQLGDFSVVVDLDLNLENGYIRDAQSDPGLPETPEEHLPVALPDGTRTVYWAEVLRRSESGIFTRVGWERIPFDPRNLKIRVQQFTEGETTSFYSGYFFIANGGTTASAQEVRQLAFKLEDRYAFYAKIQFTSMTARSPEEFTELASSYLSENLGEILTCLPDWIEVEQAVDAGRDPNEVIGDS